MLKNKVTIITGAGSGIGRATALLFAKKGAKVVVTDIDRKGGEETARMISGSGGEVIFVEANVSKASDVEKMVKTVVGKYRRIDVLFNNAGVELPKNVVATTEEELHRIINTNLIGEFLCLKFVIPHMIEQGGGSIINMGSVGGYVGYPDSAAYTASKGGVISLTRSTALDFAQHKIRVNCICPSIVLTPLVEGYISGSKEPEKVRETFMTMQPIGRIAEAEEVAKVVLFLASEEASYITGAIIPIDGGYTAK